MSGPWGDAPISLAPEQERAVRDAWVQHGSGGWCPLCEVERCRESTIAAAVLIHGGLEPGGQPNGQVAR
jgi:hypothetical protein